MPYKPKFCCQCGGTIERINWTIKSSRRFCELCETEFGIYDLLPRLALGGGIILAMFGVGSFWMPTAKPLNVVPNQLVSSSQNFNKEPSNLKNSNGQTLPKSVGNQQLPTVQQNSKPKPTTVLNAPEQTPEVVYFCGAETKKGTPCSRRVKGGGRCWQHIGQAALLPDKKLVANQ